MKDWNLTHNMIKLLDDPNIHDQRNPYFKTCKKIDGTTVYFAFQTN